MASIREDHLNKARELVSSISAGLERLEERQVSVHPSYDQETIDGYLGGIVADLAKADSSIWGAIDDFKEEML